MSYPPGGMCSLFSAFIGAWVERLRSTIAVSLEGSLPWDQESRALLQPRLMSSQEFLLTIDLGGQRQSTAKREGKEWEGQARLIRLEVKRG